MSYASDALIDALTRENKQLCDENAKLHMRVASLESASEGMHLIREMDAAENAKLRELCADMLWTIKHAHGWYKNDTHEMLMTDVRGRDGEPTNVSHSLTTDEEMYEKRMRELGISEGKEDK